MHDRANAAPRCLEHFHLNLLPFLPIYAANSRPVRFRSHEYPLGGRVFLIPPPRRNYPNWSVTGWHAKCLRRRWRSYGNLSYGGIHRPGNCHHWHSTQFERHRPVHPHPQNMRRSAASVGSRPLMGIGPHPPHGTLGSVRTSFHIRRVQR